MGMYRYLPVIWAAFFSCPLQAVTSFPLIQEAYFAPHYMLLILGGLFVFFMQSGLAIVEGGYDPDSNIKKIYCINYLAAGVGCILYLLMSHLFIKNTVGLGLYWDFLIFDWRWNLFFFYMLMATTINMVVSRIVPKNVSILQYWWVALVISSIVFAVNSQMISGGFAEQDGLLQQIGFIDFAGATIVHSTAAWIVLAGYWVLGKHEQDAIRRRDMGSDDWRFLSMALGSFILWLAWSGLNASYISAIHVNIQVIVINTLTCILGAILAVKQLGWWFDHKVTFDQLIKAALGSLVAITACCGLVSAFVAMIIGLVSGALVFLLSRVLAKKISAKNIVDVLVIHGACGIWGTLAVVFSNHPVVLAGGNMHFGVQLLGVIVNFVWSFSAAWILFNILLWYRKKTKKIQLDQSASVM